jgi:excisionase family DNA binding protein
MNDDVLLLTVPETARRLSLSRAKVYELLNAGLIDSVTIGRARRVPLAACERFVADLEAIRASEEVR